MKLEDALLYLVLDPRRLADRPLETVCRDAIAGGVDVIELPAGDLEPGVLTELTGVVSGVCREDDALFLVDDVARVAGTAADGFRLREGDARPMGQARALAGLDKLAGASVRTPDEAQLAQEAGADFLLFGVDAGIPDPLLRARWVVDIPLFPAGGISHETAARLVQMGFYRLCVDAAVLDAADVREAAARFSRLLGREI
ncbi:MAG: thiamine phosphate synthase [Kiritimatiellae bacterium]|nr:thiamine phosphate synthase [Kiritimatiellia bacterium]